MEIAKIDNYTITPRYIAADYRNGKITIPERNLLLWLRVNGSPYGIAIVDMATYANETFNSPVDKNYINKILLSLKSKRYIWYMDRAGRRGSFDVHMGDWILPSKQLKTLEKHFGDITDRGEPSDEVVTETEVSPENPSVSQSLQSKKSITNKQQISNQIRELVRGCDNDTNNDKNKEKESLQSLPIKKRDYNVGRFKPDSMEEQQCLAIAKDIGDSEVSFCLGIYYKYGMDILENAKAEFVNSDGYDKNNPPAFFNSIVQQLL